MKQEGYFLQRVYILFIKRISLKPILYLFQNMQQTEGEPCS